MDDQRSAVEQLKARTEIEAEVMAYVFCAAQDHGARIYTQDEVRSFHARDPTRPAHAPSSEIYYHYQGTDYQCTVSSGVAYHHPLVNPLLSRQPLIRQTVGRAPWPPPEMPHGGDGARA